MIAWLRRAGVVRPDVATRRVKPTPDPAMAVPVGDTVLPLHLRRLPRARQMTLRLAPDGRALRMSVPQWLPASEALAFAMTRKAWIVAQLARHPGTAPLAPGDRIGYRGSPVTLVWRSDASRRPLLDGDRIVIGGPLESLGPRLARWLEGEALRLMQGDLAHFCAVAGKPVPALALSRAQRRWGSCAANGTIRLNWRLIMAPDHVRRSVVAHEVAHLCHFDHSAAFHACLDRLFDGDLAAANAWLKAHGRALYAPFG